MLRNVLVIAAPLAVIAACTPNTPPPPPPAGNDTCTVGDATIQRPSATDIPARLDGADIDMSCIGAPATLSAAANATLQGCIAIFGLGSRAKHGIQVSVFDDAQDAHKDAPAHGTVDIAVQEDATGLDCAGADKDSAACFSLGCDKAGAYRIDNIPLHVPLTLKVNAPGDDTIIDTYTFGIVFDFGDAPLDADTNVVTYEANLIYKSTYDSIPTLAGRLMDGGNIIGDGLGRGVIAGEIHDCTDTIVSGASVTTDQIDTKTKITYFNGDTENPEPDLARTSTNTDGLYVVLNANTDPGKDVHTISAGILDPACADGTKTDCQCVGLSSRAVHVFADSVSIVTLRGDLPVLQ